MPDCGRGRAEDPQTSRSQTNHLPLTPSSPQTDDCPSWANWSCPPSGGPGKRSSLVVASEKFEFTKRGYIPKRLSVAQHKRLGKAKMPKGLKRGGSESMVRTAKFSSKALID